MNKIVLAASAVLFAALAQAQPLSSEDLARRTIERRAIEAINWGMSTEHHKRRFLNGSAYSHV